MSLPWDGLRPGGVGRAIDAAADTLHLNEPFLKTPLIPRGASDFVTKALPFKGVGLAGVVAAPLAMVAGPVGPIVVLAAKVKRWRAAGPIHPLVRAL